MENKKVRKKLNEVVAMLDGKSYVVDKKDTKLRVEMAKLKLLSFNTLKVYYTST